MSSPLPRRRWLAAAAGLAMSARAATQTATAASETGAFDARDADRGPMAPLLSGLDGDHFPIDSVSPLARRYFDQGVLLVFGFNPAEAARSFEAATTLDPDCASCWWGLAWALGPNINSDMDPGAAAMVDRALRQARRHAGHAAPVQRALIDALTQRHPAPGVLDEEAYAARMKNLAQRQPRQAMVALLAAEAVMNLHPYDWWTDKGAPQPWTPAIEALLQRAMALQPRLAGAHHYWIHLQESSPHPEHALASAKFLEHAVPGSGHLLHMPSHIYMRVGRYEDAIRANQRSIEADRRYLAEVDAQGAYRVGYVAHNFHFLWAAASMAGRRQLALEAAQAAWPAACGPARRDPATAIVQQYAVLPYFTLVRFGLWDRLLHDTLPPDTHAPYPLAIWHYAQGTALARGGRLDDAQGEFEQLESIAAQPALQTFRIKNINPAAHVARIAVLTLRADLAAARGDTRAAVPPLREATRVEDALAYDEPHLWLAPTRQALGMALLAAGQPRQAEQVYREDLAHYPANGWSLGGLAIALQRLHQPTAARAAAAQTDLAFGHAERRPVGSRF